jgi:hypothetical protein
LVCGGLIKERPYILQVACRGVKLFLYINSEQLFEFRKQVAGRPAFGRDEPRSIYAAGRHRLLYLLMPNLVNQKTALNAVF